MGEGIADAWRRSFETHDELEIRARYLVFSVPRSYDWTSCGLTQLIQGSGGQRSVSRMEGVATMNQSSLAAVAPLMIVVIAFTIGAFAAHRERAQRTARTAAEQTSRRATAVA